MSIESGNLQGHFSEESLVHFFQIYFFRGYIAFAVCVLFLAVRYVYNT